jgi:hypothetical protein
VLTVVAKSVLAIGSLNSTFKSSWHVSPYDGKDMDCLYF